MENGFGNRHQRTAKQRLSFTKQKLKVQIEIIGGDGL